MASSVIILHSTHIEGGVIRQREKKCGGVERMGVKARCKSPKVARPPCLDRGKRGWALTFSELKKKDIICIGDGRLLGRVVDLAFDPGDGRVNALIISNGGGVSCMFRGEKSHMEIAWRHIACIGDDVILISPGGCC